MTTGLVTEITKFVELVRESQFKEVHEAKRTLTIQGRDPRNREYRTLLD